MAVYQDKARDRIKSGLRKYRGVVQKARLAQQNESDTRRLVTHMLGQLLGWDIFEEVSGEYRVKGNFADFVIKYEGKLLAVIEVKEVASTLSTKHLYQAVTYAANEGIDWVVLTNGAEWHLYRVVFGKPINQNLVFKLDVLDAEAKPKDVIECLYLLSREAQRKSELEAFYQKKAALCGENITKVLLSKPVLEKLRAEVRKATGHLLPMDELANLLVEEVVRPDVQTEETAKLVRKALAKKPTKKDEPAAEAS